MQGFWTVQATRLAKAIKSKCVICRFLDKTPILQTMGTIPEHQLVQPVAWGHVEIDLFGPFVCRSDVQKRSTCKVWGMVMVDRNSGAVHCDVVRDYSAQELIKSLRRFASIRGWPSAVYSDPGSQLVSSSGRLESWWTTMSKELSSFATDTRFSWNISPANSPWRQGRCEVRIKSIKKLLTISVGMTKLTPLELQTALFEAANLSNERPIGVNTKPRADGSFKVLTPNCLMMGRSQNAVPDDSNLASHFKRSKRYQLIQQVTADFWSRWTQEVTPASVVRQRWHDTGRNLQVGDLVLVHDKSEVKGTYILGKIEKVCPGSDGLVRSCQVGYRIPNAKDPMNVYSGGKKISVSRSVQRLTLLLPIEEQSESLVVDGDKVVKEVK